MSALQARARSIAVEAAYKLSPIDFIQAQVADMPRGDVEKLAAAYIFAQVRAGQRRQTLTVEREAEKRFSEPKYGTRAWDAWSKLPQNAEAAEHTLHLKAELAEVDTRHTANFVRMFNENMDKYAAEMRIQWTQELLDSEFATGDGIDVKWGDATRDQHEARMLMHQRNAVAGAEGYARHMQAVEMLDTTGAPCLRDAVMQAA